MNILKNESGTIQLASFHVLKAFLWNSNKPPRVQCIIVRNKEQFVRLLLRLSSSKKKDQELNREVTQAIRILEEMYLISVCPVAVAESQMRDALAAVF